MTWLLTVGRYETVHILDFIFILNFEFFKQVDDFILREFIVFVFIGLDEILDDGGVNSRWVIG